MLLNSVLLLHVCAAAVGLLSGYTAIVFRKGSGLHAAAGTIFFGSMLTASSAGVLVAALLRPNAGNFMGSALTLYLVTTAWVAARRREGRPGPFDLGAMLFAAALGLVCAMWGVQAASSQGGSKDGYEAPFFFVFGAIALLFAASDVRMLVRGGVFGAQRIARHLLRMCMTLLFAVLSSQGRIYPSWVRETGLVYVPIVLLVGVMVFSLYRVRVRKRVPRVAELPRPGHELAAAAIDIRGAA